MPVDIKSILSYAAAVIGFSAFVWAIWIVGTDGLSSLSVKNALVHESVGLANQGISLNSSNPEAYYARASLYRASRQTSEAIADFEHAAKLKPGDHFLRLELGFTRYQVGDIQGATADFEAATQLAPFYAQPRWYLGNMLLQAERLDDGFAELRLAVKSDPSYLPDMIQRATEAFAGDSAAIIKAINPGSSETRLALERYFIQQGNISSAMELFRTGKDVPLPEVGALLSELLTAKRFAEAHEVWLLKKRTNRFQNKETSSISDGGFESEIEPNATGFEWQLERRLEKTRVWRDSNEFNSGHSSFCVEYDGKSNPAASVVSHLVLVEPNTEYRLSFAAQTKDLVTGGLPIITVTDATDGRLLAQSIALPERTSSWRNYLVDCKTGPGTRAVAISVQRGACSASPCPAFGRVWFDDFSWRNR